MTGPARRFPFFRTGESDVGETLDEILGARDRLGGKSASLHAMAALGFRVPPGFTIPTDRSAPSSADDGSLAGELREELQFAIVRLEEITGRQLRRERRADGDDLDERLRAVPHDPRPLRVAVRSGAAESLPGMMDTVLDVETHEDIERAVARVLASYSSERAIIYRREMGIVGLGGTAVTVQEMCPAEIAGVAFTVDITGDERALRIEAVPGLGESLVSGEATPDRHVLSRSDLSLLSSDPAGPSALLPDTTLRELAASALELERAFGHPLDIEWALAGGTIWWLQCRKIRSPSHQDPALRALLTCDARRFTEASLSGTTLLARHNLDETLRHPTPMSWDLHRRFFRGPDGLIGLYRDLGFHPSTRVEREGFLALVAGHIFAETERAAELFFGSDIVGWDPDALRARPALIDEPPGRWRRGSASLPKLFRALSAMRRSSRRQRALRQELPRRFEETALAEWSAWLESEDARALESPAAADLLLSLDRRVERCFGQFPRKALALSYLAGIALGELEDFLERRLGRDAGRETALRLTGASGEDPSVARSLDLSRLARGELALESFLSRWGHRGAGEMELASPRWGEQPEAVLRLAASIRESSEAIDRRIEERQISMREEESRLRARLREDCGPDAVDELDRRLAFARGLLPWRESWKHHWMRGLALVRDALLRLDRRLGLEGQIFWLELDELRQVVETSGPLDAELRERIRRRHDAARLAASIDVPDVVDAETLARIERGEPASPPPIDPLTSTDDTLDATPIAPGLGAGRAWICDSPSSECPFDAPFVLVCRSTDPGWMPLLARASALVVERGGSLSHGAIVCRDLGVPAVVLADATTRIESGISLNVDGDRGRIEIRRPTDSTSAGARNAGAAASSPPSQTPDIPPEPWVKPLRAGTGRRVAVGLAVAVLASIAILATPAVGGMLLPLARAACDWTLRAGATPFLAILWAAGLSALLATTITLCIVDRVQLRAMRARISWYRSTLRSLRKAPATGSTGRVHERSVESMTRRLRRASTERTLALLLPIGWTFLPLVLASLWVNERFPAEPLRPGATFEVHATFRLHEASRLRFARLEIEPPSRARLVDRAWKKLTPNTSAPELGPHRIVWALEAREEGRARLLVTAGAERMEDEVLITNAREFASAPASANNRATASELTGLYVDYPALEVELPTPIFRVVRAIGRWLSGGREIDPGDVAMGPMLTFLALAVLLVLLFQRIAGVR